MRKSSPRLWSRHHHVEEQATERHTDRERVGQLASPPLQESSSFPVSQRRGQGCGRSAPATWARWTRSGGAGCPRWRETVGGLGRVAIRRTAASAPALEQQRRPLAGLAARGLAQAEPRAERAGTTSSASSDAAGRSRSRSPGARPATRPSQPRAHVSSSGAAAGSPPPCAHVAPGRRAGRAGAPSIRDPVDARVLAVRQRRSPGRSRAPPPAPSRAARPRSRAPPTRTPGRELAPSPAGNASISSRHSRVVACAPVPNACPGSITISIGTPIASSHGGRTASRSPEHERPVKLAPPLVPVVGDLRRANLDQRVARGRGQVGQRRQLARRPVHRVLDDRPSPTDTSSTPPGASSSSSASTISACSRRTRTARRITSGRRPYPPNARLSFPNTPSSVRRLCSVIESASCS